MFVDFFDVVKKRRSVRRYTETPVPDQVMEWAFDAAILAPNSSNTQTWDFYWVQSPDKKQQLIKACMSQSAARTANQLVVVTANPKLWKRSLPGLIAWVTKAQAPPLVQTYYKKLIPVTYRWGFLNLIGLFRFVVTAVIGFFRPINRGPYTRKDHQLVAAKSAALACENFVLAVSAQGYSTCMMEGFDEKRVKKILRLDSDTCVVRVIGVGQEAERGTWGEQYRLPRVQVVHRI